MKLNQQRPGYIMVLTLMIISMTLILVTQLYDQGRVHVAFVKTMLDREKAKMLAFSGVQMALSQLTVKKSKEEKNTISSAKNKKPGDEQRRFLEKVLPALNRWQVFTLQKNRDGIDGKIRISISCEDGKLNLNELFDFKTKMFKGANKMRGDVNKVFRVLMVRLKEVGGKELVTSLLDFLSKRGYHLNDVTELLADKRFGRFKDLVFYEPPSSGAVKTADGKRPVYLTDIFTVWSDGMTIEPWLLSDSVCAMLGFKRAAIGDVGSREQRVTQWLKSFKPTAQWSTDWNKSLKGVYGKEFGALPQGVDMLLATKFEPTTFCVVSYGTAGKITQRLFAVIKREKKAQYSAFKIKKLYWI